MSETHRDPQKPTVDACDRCGAPSPARFRRTLPVAAGGCCAASCGRGASGCSLTWDSPSPPASLRNRMYQKTERPDPQ